MGANFEELQTDCDGCYGRLGALADMCSNRYNLFFVLYPVGILSEMRLIHLSIPAASATDPRLGYILWSILAIYIPGTPAVSCLLGQSRVCIGSKLTIVAV